MKQTVNPEGFRTGAATMKKCYKAGKSCCQSFIRNIMANCSVVVFISVFVLLVQLVELVDGMPTENVAIKSTAHRQKRNVYTYTMKKVGDELCTSDRIMLFYSLLRAKFTSCVRDDIFALNLTMRLCGEKGALRDLFVATLYDRNGDGELSPEEIYDN